MKKLLSGTPLLKCKTPNCVGKIYFGDFVLDLIEWKEEFKNQQLTCPTCKKKNSYSRDDLVLIPAINPAEKE